jgi:hypothetical protein
MALGTRQNAMPTITTIDLFLISQPSETSLRFDMPMV